MYWQKRLDIPAPDSDLERVIQSIYEENNQGYGHLRIGLSLRKRGIVVNYKKNTKNNTQIRDSMYKIHSEI